MIEVVKQDEGTEIPAGISKDLLLAQYSSLRSEVHQRLDQRQQLLTYALIGAASFFSIGVQPQVASITVLCYPLLAFFLACAWGQHDARIGEITVFLRAMEDRGLFGALGPGWETYRRTTFKKRRFSLFDSISLSARGLFAGSDVLALVLGVSRFFMSPQMVGVFLFLLVVDLVVIVATLMALSHRRTRGVMLS